jgi:hypothetical protein
LILFGAIQQPLGFRKELIPLKKSGPIFLD